MSSTRVGDKEEEEDVVEKEERVGERDRERRVFEAKLPRA